jgi:Poly (ADP-ribose) glycohydrolase (PARG)
MMDTVLPRIETLARHLPPEGIDILKAGQNGTRQLSKLHIAHILACGFFCIFSNNDNLPRINFDKYMTCANISDIVFKRSEFQRLYSATNVSTEEKTDSWRKEKLKCLITYFKTIITS